MQQVWLALPFCLLALLLLACQPFLHMGPNDTERVIDFNEVDVPPVLIGGTERLHAAVKYPRKPSGPAQKAWRRSSSLSARTVSRTVSKSQESGRRVWGSPILRSPPCDRWNSSPVNTTASAFLSGWSRSYASSCTDRRRSITHQIESGLAS